MTFTPFDALALFIGAAILVGAAAYVLMRSKLDLMAWAALSAGSLPSTVYFTLRNTRDFGVVFEVAGGVGLVWGALLALIWMRWRTSSLMFAAQPVARPPLEPAQLDPPSQPSPVGWERRSIAYLLFGFGVPTSAASTFILRMLFIPGRHGPALMPLSVNSAPFQICATALAIGLALIAAGWWLLRPDGGH
jgi:hypothetical protein